MSQLGDQIDIQKCLAVIDRCTQHEAVYLHSDDPVKFWHMVAGTLAWTPSVTSQQLQAMVSAICHKRRACLLRGEIPPRRSDTEKLDSAIDHWLEIEGRRAFDRAIRNLLNAARLAFGPEDTGEDDLLTKQCQSRWRSNQSHIALLSSAKGKASRLKGLRLVQAVESITAREAQQLSKKCPGTSRAGCSVEEPDGPLDGDSDVESSSQCEESESSGSSTETQTGPSSRPPTRGKSTSGVSSSLRKPDLGTLTTSNVGSTPRPLNMGTLTPSDTGATPRPPNIGTLALPTDSSPPNYRTLTPSDSSAPVTTSPQKRGPKSIGKIDPKRQRVNKFASQLAGSPYDVYEYRGTPECGSSSEYESCEDVSEPTPTRPPQAAVKRPFAGATTMAATATQQSKSHTRHQGSEVPDSDFEDSDFDSASESEHTASQPLPGSKDAQPVDESSLDIKAGYLRSLIESGISRGIAGVPIEDMITTAVSRGVSGLEAGELGEQVARALVIRIGGMECRMNQRIDRLFQELSVAKGAAEATVNRRK